MLRAMMKLRLVNRRCEKAAQGDEAGGEKKDDKELGRLGRDFDECPEGCLDAGVALQALAQRSRALAVEGKELDLQHGADGFRHQGRDLLKELLA